MNYMILLLSLSLSTYIYIYIYIYIYTYIGMYINISYTRPAPARFRGHHAPKLDDTSWGSGAPIGKSGKCYENAMKMVSKNALG